MRIPLDIIKVQKSVRTTALIDSEATHSFISPRLVKKHHWKVKKLRKPMPVYNADATQNIEGEIHFKVPLYFRIGHKLMFQYFYVTNIESDDLVLGMTWLQRYNPMISWVDKKVRFREGSTVIVPDAPKPISPDWVAQQTIRA